MRHARRALAIAGFALAAAVGLAPSAGAQQIVDAGKEGDGSGGLAFVLLAVLVMLTWAALFFMDRVRRRGEESSTE
jgi:hypothetical protein